MEANITTAEQEVKPEVIPAFTFKGEITEELRLLCERVLGRPMTVDRVWDLKFQRVGDNENGLGQPWHR